MISKSTEEVRKKWGRKKKKKKPRKISQKKCTKQDDRE
jgi:hypothetical protein